MSPFDFDPSSLATPPRRAADASGTACNSLPGMSVTVHVFEARPRYIPQAVGTEREIVVVFVREIVSPDRSSFALSGTLDLSRMAGSSRQSVSSGQSPS